MKGTSANLQYSDFVSVENLLYGLMLPSGNDAALALAEWGGKTIRNYCTRRGTTSPSNKHRAPIKFESSKRSNVSLFIYHMNCAAKALFMENTRFSNVHGLMNKRNYSTTRDLTKLCLYAMSREDFRTIVNTREYRCTVTNKKYAN